MMLFLGYSYYYAYRYCVLLRNPEDYAPTKKEVASR